MGAVAHGFWQAVNRRDDLAHAEPLRQEPRQEVFLVAVGVDGGDGHVLQQPRRAGQNPGKGMASFGNHIGGDSGGTQFLGENAFVQRQSEHPQARFAVEVAEKVEDHNLGPGPEIAREDMDYGRAWIFQEA